ncbi:MAG TPA: Na+/H+ antiporter NhaC [Longimicrobiales bacterium]|nr:Na+/H+ antiporter NhaC [Longimicrobiales bacterium]
MSRGERSESERPARGGLSLAEALLPIVVMVALFIAGSVSFGMTGELLIAVLLVSAASAGWVATRHGASWDDIQRSTGRKLADVLPAILILLAIGVLIAAWIVSGTIPFLVYWGVRLISPRFLVLTAFLATAAMSLATGTSWGSAGTIGVALMGTAVALDAPLAITAGAVVSGAYLGDKMSPLSDSTNIAAIGAGADLYRHIRNMVYTAGPSFALALVAYSAVAFATPGPAAGAPTSARALLGDLSTAFRLSPLVLVPVAVVVWGIARRAPAALAMIASSVVAALIGVALQGIDAVQAVTAMVGGFRVPMLGSAGVDPQTMGAALTTLVERGGLYAMAPTLIVILAAFLLAGAMDASGSLDLLIGRMLAAVRGVGGLIAATMASGATMIALTSHGGVTSLVIGDLYQGAYRERGLAPENLSRSLEDSVTITEPLMPWTVSAVYMATTLGVPTLAYAPWAVFCFCGPLFSLLIAGLYPRTAFALPGAAAGSVRASPASAPGAPS